ncbi:MAG TPA: MotA/TolQ/ExbB proton channel family protein [Chromatiales bacterium]|nr:MotA/TolQ/ExbB proton channel family protein [Chromatiales bacterium]
MRATAKGRSAMALLAALAFVAPVAGAEEPKSLAQLLEEVRRGAAGERAEDKQREEEFRAAKARQQELLAEARAVRAAAEAKSVQLEAVFEEKEKMLPDLQESLRTRLGTLGELFGVVRQVAGDTAGFVRGSLISTQIPGRAEFLDGLAESTELPSVEDLEKLWFVLQQEMTETGRVTRYDHSVVAVDGSENEREVIRIGVFNALSETGYLRLDDDTGKLVELARQPAARHLSAAAKFVDAESGMHPVSIDPSRGTILSMLVQSPTLEERVQQGGLVGYIIIALGVVGLIVALYRFIYLGIVGGKIKSQAKRDEHDKSNPLGRVLSVYDDNREADVETLELKLDEAILKETPALERGNALVKVLSVVAPLLGLLGTVTGMIQVFQQIQLFGTGDPKLMAGGISLALVTTVLGLVMAIPLVLLHSVLSGRTKSLVQILEEQSAGIIARHAERGGVRAAGH